MAGFLRTHAAGFEKLSGDRNWGWERETRGLMIRRNVFASGVGLAISARRFLIRQAGSPPCAHAVETPLALLRRSRGHNEPDPELRAQAAADALR